MSTADSSPADRRDAAPTAAVAKRAPRQQSLELAAVAPPALRRPPAPATRPGQLWLGLYLPRLPLETAACAEDSPLYAVFEERKGLREVLQASPPAEASGVRPGLSVNAALALAPGLELGERDPAAEEVALQALAAWAERYSSRVVLEAPLLLLEIAASLRLFGGLKALRRRIVRELAAEGYSAWPAIAPTPLAATWLARSGERRCVTDAGRLAGALGGLPLDCLDWPERNVAALRGMGIGEIGELLRLPREGFARRFGAARLDELDRAIGRRPDPRRHFRAPQPFVADHDLDEEQDDRDRLLAICDGLLAKLERFLRQRQLATQRLRLQFFHLRAAATPLVLGGLQPSVSGAHWLALLGIRLECLPLPEPVIGIRLVVDELQPLAADTAGFGFGADGGASVSIAPLVERLSARIGAQAVHGVGTLAEHRPDRAWCRPANPAMAPRCEATPGHGMPALFADLQRTERLLLRRPLWMLDEPEPLGCRDGRPCHEGPLSIHSGPERIETGWWDAASVARDYYVARTPAGSWLWVFRDRREGGWYLHGFFG